MTKASFSGHFGMIISDHFLIILSATCSLEVNALVSLKVATIRHFRGQKPSKVKIFKAIILKQKQRSAAKVIYVFLILLKYLYLD